MKFLLSLVVFMVLLLPQTGFSSNASAGNLHTIHYMNNGIVVVYTTGTRTGNLQDCATNQPQRFAIDAKTEAGKVQLTGLLTAYTTGKPVVIIGKGDNCECHGDTETINYFYTAD